MLTSLVARSCRRAAAPLIALASVLALVQFAFVGVAVSFENTRSFERLIAFVPTFVSRGVSGSFLALASFRTMAVAGYLHPVVVLALVEFAIYVATEPAGDVEQGLVDLVLARPIARQRLITRSLLVTASGTAAVVCTMSVVSALGVAWLAPALVERPTGGTIARLGTELLLLSWSFGAIALAAAAFARRRAAAALAVGVVAIAMYLLEFLGAVWTRVEPLARVSPFDYYEGLGILTGRADVARDLLVLGSVTAAAVFIAYWRFSRRDL